MVSDAPRHGAINAVDLLEIGKRSVGHGAGRSEVMEKGPLALRTDARDLVEQGMTDTAGALRAMGANGEAMRLVRRRWINQSTGSRLVRHQRVTSGQGRCARVRFAVRSLATPANVDTGNARGPR